MKTKLLFIFFTILLTSCSSDKSTNKDESSTPSSRLDSLESKSNKTFKEID